VRNYSHTRFSESELDRYGLLPRQLFGLVIAFPQSSITGAERQSTVPGCSLGLTALVKPIGILKKIRPQASTGHSRAFRQSYPCGRQRLGDTGENRGHEEKGAGESGEDVLEWSLTA
jgi:hypothetical protein